MSITISSSSDSNNIIIIKCNNNMNTIKLNKCYNFVKYICRLAYWGHDLHRHLRDSIRWSSLATRYFTLNK